MDMGAMVSNVISVQQLQFQQNYAVAVTEKAMDTQALAGQELLRMLPQEKSQHVIDVYA